MKTKIKIELRNNKTSTTFPIFSLNFVTVVPFSIVLITMLFMTTPGVMILDPRNMLGGGIMA